MSVRRGLIRIAVVLLLQPFSIMLGAGRRSITLVPMKGTSVTLLVEGKERDYYLLERGDPMEIQLDGPGKLVIISRLKLPKESPDVQKYTLRVEKGKLALK